MTSAHSYDLTDPQVMADPYAFYRAIHGDDAKVVEVPGVGGWIGRMADVKVAAKQTETFSNSYFDEGGPIPTGVSGETSGRRCQSNIQPGARSRKCAMDDRPSGSHLCTENLSIKRSPQAGFDLWNHASRTSPIS